MGYGTPYELPCCSLSKAMHRSLTRRLDALEERHTSDHGMYAASVEKFHT